MSDPLVRREGFDAEALAATFDQMAAQIRLNKDANFGGAFVLVPPPGVGSPVDALIMNSTNASMMFWTNLQSIVSETIKALVEQQRMAGR
jgi:hypothetical protein